ncbi:GGDEF domain-containing protein [Erythrobacter crassostreae]|uniref:diguanylate cyclase n=1 Tax=Erythrobacter crassostreae TaxID=2828328 RepID=A0A9X1F3V4_9SPHN|nr:GGDEF domain-containing protein [Erythrobacter crassostrea]MBV7259592.1 GGDEF domain-containing protein [Erythrobacter crassostrea]
MAGANAIFLVIPAVYGLFALALAVIAVMDQKIIAARWAALGFFIAGLSITVDAYRSLTTIDWLGWFTVVCHHLALLGMMQAFVVRHQPHVPKTALALVTIGAVMLLPGVPWELSPWLRTMTVQGVGSAIILTGAGALFAHRRKTPVDLIAFFVTGIAGTLYAARVFIALFYPTGQGSEAVASYYSWISMIFHTSSAIMAILVGLLLMVAIGHDMLQGEILQGEIDPLTKLGNRRRMERAISEDREDGRSIGAVIAIDLDHFKKINDLYGHDAGDVVLRRVGTRLLSLLHPFGEVCRIGGEEFVVLIYDDFAPGTSALALALRKAIATLEFDGVLAKAKVTASIGFHLREDGKPVSGSIQRADQAVYCAKADGRDRVVGAETRDGFNVLKAVA